MPDGVRAELVVHEPANCPLAALADESDAPVTDVTWATGENATAEEFRVASDDTEAAAALDAVTPVVDVGEERVYRFERDSDTTCACELVESLGSPVADVRLDDGTLVLTLHLESVDRLRTVVGELSDAAERVELNYLVHTGTAAVDDGDPTVVDRNRLTDRQRDVVRTAHRMGYFSYPREANATAVADELGIGPSTFAEHLAAAQRTLLDDLLRE
ncbi:helix-turn-helix domain-containing protein [Haloplanus natans]|uniref:helix-turn-helix domain-containing protein n=1 Tax=Haloplanus natans TaxID=376171 RepID=UPI00067802B5|nr:helix-turn-helix domain-containing protein [Haloplanus natans]